MKTLKVSFSISLWVLALLLLCVAGAGAWVKWQYNLPSERWVRHQFESQKADYIQLVSLLQKDPSSGYIDGDGKVDIDSIHSRSVPEYRHLIRKMGAKHVIVREDGSMEFALRGFGCAICSDSYMGVRYVPKVLKKVSHPGWTQALVASLETARLPQENGSVATGLYVVPIEPDWFIYRLEIQE